MDLLMQSIPGSLPYDWDFTLDEYGVAVTIDSDNELIQQAEVAAYLYLGSTPQLPLDGVDWQNFLFGYKTFGEIDSEIKTNISYLGPTTLYPDYDIINNKLHVKIRRS